MEPKRLLSKFVAAIRKLWDREGIRQAVGDNLEKLIACRTLLLGAEIYASDTETKTICHACKSRFCPGCGNRATLTWQREQWRALPDVRYSEICFTMPKIFWGYFQQDRRLLSDIAALAASVIMRWIGAHYGVVPYVLVIPHTFGQWLSRIHLVGSPNGVTALLPMFTRLVEKLLRIAAFPMTIIKNDLSGG